jgi:hypothetical protein
MQADDNVFASMVVQGWTLVAAGAEYAELNIAGHVLIEVTKTGGPNAVVSGIFFD